MSRLIGACLSSMLLASVASSQEAKRLTLERLYSLPNLIGTAPTGFAWAGNSRRLAYLWNEEGRNFRDVWILDTANGESRRATRMARLELPVVPESASELPEADAVIEARIENQREQDRGVTAVAMHPDGQRFLFTFRGDLYVSSADDLAEPSRLTKNGAGVSRPVYAPGGEGFAYLESGRLWLAESDGGTPASPLSEPSEPDERRSVVSFRFSPDGASIVYLEANRTRVPLRSIPDYLPPEPLLHSVSRQYPGDPSPEYRLGIVSVEGGETRWLSLGREPMDPIFGYRFSPDSERLLVDTSDLYVKDRRILSVELRGGAFRVLVREQNPLNVQALWQAEWGPNGEFIYFLSDRENDTDVFRLDVREHSSAGPQRVTDGEFAVFSFSVRETGIFFVGNPGHPEQRHLFHVPRGGGTVSRLTARAGTHQPALSPDGRYAADFFSSDTDPYDLWLMDFSFGSSASTPPTKRITRSPIDEFSEYEWVSPEYVSFESHVDGVTLQGRLTIPPGLDRSKKHPAILGSVYSNTVRNQWGGRTAHPTWALDQYLVQEGYILLNVNFRGSLGHGKAFRQGIRLDYGGIDVEDLHSGVKYLETLGFVDMDRIGIWGSSYGGLLTCMSLFKKPGVYKAGVAGAPATNVWHALTGEMRVMMAPEDQPEEYADSSAYLHADGLEDHLMIIHGMRDRIVLFKDSVTLVQRLMLLEKDVDFVVLPDSRHGWDNQGLYQTRFAFRKLVDHFDRYLGKGPTQ